MDAAKGMSQTLALIVAASVLMMTALTVIFMTQGSLTDVFSGSNKQSCISTVKAKCSAGSETVSLPASCERADITRGTIPTTDHSVSGDEVTCSGGDSCPPNPPYPPGCP